MGILVTGNIVTNDGFALTSIYISLNAFNFRSALNFQGPTPSNNFLNAQFSCYKSRDDKVASKLPIQAPIIFTSVNVTEPFMYMDPYATAYSALSSKLVKEGYTTSIVLESGQVDGSQYIYNSQGVSRPTA